MSPKHRDRKSCFTNVSKNEPTMNLGYKAPACKIGFILVVLQFDKSVHQIQSKS